MYQFLTRRSTKLILKNDFTVNNIVLIPKKMHRLTSGAPIKGIQFPIAAGFGVTSRLFDVEFDFGQKSLHKSLINVPTIISNLYNFNKIFKIQINILLFYCTFLLCFFMTQMSTLCCEWCFLHPIFGGLFLPQVRFS